MKKKKDVNTFQEAYTIKGTYQKDDGFYTSFEETQLVPVSHGVNEKNNHNDAVEIFMNYTKAKDFCVSTPHA
jgi:hypothetical protein